MPTSVTGGGEKIARLPRGLFAQELAAAKALLLMVPKIGPVYASLDGQPVRRVLMKKTKTHVYYVLEANLRQITVHAVWGAPKRSGPKF